MKIHAMYGLDLPTSSASGSGSSLLYTRFPNGPWQTMMPNSETTLTVQTWTDGWVRMLLGANAYNFGNYRFRMAADIKEMIPAVGPASSLWFGVRVKASTGYTGAGLVNLSSGIDINNILEIAGSSSVPGWALDKSYYIEFNLNFAANVIRRRVDGKPLPDIAMPAWMATAVSATPGGTSVYVGIGHTSSYSILQGQSHYFYWRDFYCVEWDAGELNQFLGPQVIEKLTPAAVAGATGWVASTGDALSVLQKGYSNPSTPITAPTLTTDDAMTPAAVTYSASVIPQNAVINGVFVKGRSAVTVNATGNLGVSLTVGGVETPDTTTPMVATQTWYDRIFSAPKTPLGNPWYQPNLAGLTVKIKPKV